MSETNLPASGRMGIEPPPDAPREVSAGLTPEDRQIPADKRGNERELAPLTFGQVSGTQTAGTEAQVLGPVQGAKEVQAAPGYPQPSQYKSAPVSSEHPAASNSESPTRGMPGTAPIPLERSKAPLQVVGGFGAAEAEYYPLDGVELKTLVEQLMDELHARIQNDLRFSMALCYPRLSAKVMIVVTGEADDQSLTVEKVAFDPKLQRTPLEVAQQFGDSVTFVVTAQRREFTDAGEVDTPPDAMREELGLRVPRKRQVKMGNQMTNAVDVSW